MTNDTACRNFNLQFNDRYVRLLSDFCLHGYPNGHPIVALLARNIDNYELARRQFLCKGGYLMRKWISRRRRASKEAEMVAILIAMAQRQHQALRTVKHKTLIPEGRLVNFYVS
jgi:hypothetical protein